MRLAHSLAILLALVAGALVLSSTVPEPACAGGNCGIKPIKPIPPIGCDDMCAQCQCDASGQNCQWVWICCCLPCLLFRHPASVSAVDYAGMLGCFHAGF